MLGGGGIVLKIVVAGELWKSTAFSLDFYRVILSLNVASHFMKVCTPQSFMIQMRLLLSRNDYFLFNHKLSEVQLMHLNVPW